MSRSSGCTPSGASRTTIAGSLRAELGRIGLRGLSAAVSWNTIGMIVSRGSQVASMIVVARLLGVDRFGAFGMLVTTIAALQVICGLALGGTTTKYVSQYRAGDRARAGRVLGFALPLTLASGLLLAVLLLIAAPWLCSYVGLGFKFAGCLRILSGVLFLSGVQDVLAGALAGVHSFRRIALANVVLGLATLPANYVGARWGGLPGALWAQSGIALLMCLLMGWHLRRQLAEEQIMMDLAGWRTESGVIWRYALPSLLVGLLSTPVAWYCQKLLLRRSGLAEVAIFTAANQWFGLITFLPAVVGTVILPRLSESYGRGDRSQLRRLSLLSVALNLGIALVAGFVLASLGPWIMAAYGPAFRKGVIVLLLVIACACLTVVQLAFGHTLAAVEKMWGVAGFNFLWAAAYVVGAIAWVDRGAQGLATARLLAHVLLFLGVLVVFLMALGVVGSRRTVLKASRADDQGAGSF